MILLKFVLIILTLYIYFSKVLEFLYRYQIKEYRWDRMWSYIKEDGFFSVFYGFRLLFPGKKVRNVAIAGLLLFAAIIYGWYIYRWPVTWLQIQLILSPVLAFIDVTLLVLLSNIPVYFHREKVIAKARKKIGESDVKVIMITGSYGKTSVKEYLYDVLKEEFHVAKTDENMNTDIGVALCILKNIKKNTQYFIAEVGAYKVGEIAKICSIVKPDYVVVTAFGNQHLDLYGSHANLVKAESEPLDFLSQEGVAFINKDIPEFERISKDREFTIKSYSIKTKSADIYALGIKSDEKGTGAVVHVEESTFGLQLKLLGKHSIQNLLPVMGIAKMLGMSETKIKKAVDALEPVKNKLSMHKGPNGSLVISDAGNSNLHGFMEAIEIAGQFSYQDKYIVSKGIIELGKEKEKSYREIVAKLKECDVKLFTTDVEFIEIDDHVCTSFQDEEHLWDHLRSRLNEKTLVVIEGRFTSEFLTKLL